MKKSIRIAPLAALAIALAAAPMRADQALPSASGTPSSMDSEVRHALVMLPFYGAFDTLNYSVMGDTVTLSGQVTRPTLKSDAEAVVKRIPGVSTVVNQIEVLPLSHWDDYIRRAAYLKLFNSNSPLFRYGLGATPSIRIIVDNGHVTPKGTVSSQSDKQTTSMYVRQVFGVFSVTNDLDVTRSQGA
ncbi:MAG: BON domain-containing protein [Acidobacteria bacterium]|nr:BON domain-containing protein [Acidobacteriota bacterium]